MSVLLICQQVRNQLARINYGYDQNNLEVRSQALSRAQWRVKSHFEFRLLTSDE